MTNNINNEKNIPSQLFLIILRFFEKQSGFDSNSFLKQRGLNPNKLSQDGFTVKISFINELIDEILKAKKDYTVLYDLAKLSTPSSLGILGYLMIHSKNVYEALNKLCKYYLLIGKKIKPVFAQVDNGYKIAIYFNDENGEMADSEGYHAQIHLFAIIHLINYIIPQNIEPEFITFTQKEAAFALPNGEISGIRAYFGKEENAIYFGEDIGKIKTISSNEQLLKVFEKEAEETLRLKLNTNGLKERVSGLILISSTELDISLDSIASRARMHPRLLQLKLKEEGTSFSEILLEVRKKLSVYYLSRGIDLSMISLSLGYIDLSSFFRAFKKWYGMTPKQWKEKKHHTKHNK